MRIKIEEGDSIGRLEIEKDGVIHVCDFGVDPGPVDPVPGDRYDVFPRTPPLASRHWKGGANAAIDENGCLVADLSSFGGLNWALADLPSDKWRKIVMRIAGEGQVRLWVSEDGQVSKPYASEAIDLVEAPGPYIFDIPPGHKITNIAIAGTRYAKVRVDKICLLEYDEGAREPGGGNEGTGPERTAGQLTVSGSSIVDGDGERWLGRGCNGFDTRMCSSGSWQSEDDMLPQVLRRIDKMAEMGANFMRLCLEHRPELAANGAVQTGFVEDPGYAHAVQQAVRHAGSMGMQCLVSVWLHPDAPRGDGLGWPTAELGPDLRRLGELLSGESNVWIAPCNEPEGNWSGALNRAARDAIDNAIDEIRLGGFAGIVVAPGTARWARDVEYYAENPIDDDNVVYEIHLYDLPFEFEDQVGRFKGEIPIVVGEVGPAAQAAITEAEAVQNLGLLNDAGVSWLAWAMHHRCPPDILVDTGAGNAGDLVLTSWGREVEKAIKA